MICWLVLCVFHMFVGEIARNHWRTFEITRHKIARAPAFGTSVAKHRRAPAPGDIAGFKDGDTNGFYTRGRCMYIQDIKI